MPSMARRLPALLTAVALAAVILALAPLGEAGSTAPLPRNSVGTEQIRAQAVARGKIRDGNVTREKLAENAVGPIQLAPNAVGSSHLAVDAVGTREIAEAAVGSTEIATRAVGTSDLGRLPAAGVSGNRQSVPAGDGAALSFGQIRFSQAGVYDPGARTRLTAPVTGIYIVTANIAWARSGDGTARRLRIRRNGSVVVAEVVRRATSSDVRIASNISEIVQLNAGDYLELVASHGSRSAQTVISLGEVSPEFQLAFLSPA
jgi:hypothetical protein